jgi:hypothetical protein
LCASLGKGWERGEGAGLQPPKYELKKNTDFVDTKKSKVLHDLPFSLNQPLKPADDWYIKIVKKLTNTEMSFG